LAKALPKKMIYLGNIGVMYGIIICSILSIILSKSVIFHRDLESNKDSNNRNEENTKKTKFLSDVKTVFSNRMVLLISVGLAVTYLGIGGVNSLEVPFVMSTLNAGTTGYAFMLSWSSIAMLIGSLCYNQLNKLLKLETGYLYGTIFMSLFWGLYGLSPNYYWSLAFVLLASIANAFLNISSITLIQQHAHKDHIGKTLSLSIALHQITGALSLLLWSVTASQLGSPRIGLVMGGVLALLAIVPAILVFQKRKTNLISSSSVSKIS